MSRRTRRRNVIALQGDGAREAFADPPPHGYADWIRRPLSTCQFTPLDIDPLRGPIDPPRRAPLPTMPQQALDQFDQIPCIGRAGRKPRSVAARRPLPDTARRPRRGGAPSPFGRIDARIGAAGEPNAVLPSVLPPHRVGRAAANQWPARRCGRLGPRSTIDRKTRLGQAI